MSSNASYKLFFFFEYRLREMKGKKNYIYNWKKAKKLVAPLSKIPFFIISKTTPLSKRDVLLFSSELGLLENHTPLVSPHHHKMTHRLEITLPTETNSNLSPAYGHPSNGYKSGLNREFFTGTRDTISFPFSLPVIFQPLDLLMAMSRISAERTP